MFLIGGATLAVLFLLPFLFGDNAGEGDEGNTEPDFMPGPVVRPIPVDPDDNTFEVVELLNLSNKPSPGMDYEIQPGDSLLGIAGRAYGLGPGPARLRAARAINNDPRNAAYLGPSGQNFQLIGPEGVGSAFFPKWQCGNTRNIVHTLGGSCYGVLYIPQSY